MPRSAAATQDTAGATHPCGAATWLALAASPTFALMGWIAATGAPAMPLCAAAPGMLPTGGMAAMYLLMGLFHLSPWLKLAANARARI